MNKAVVLTLKVLGGLLAAIILLLAVAFAAFHTDAVQSRLVQKATDVLSDYLQTTVHIEKANVSFIGQGVSLSGVEIEDRQHRKMFQMEELGVHHIYCRYQRPRTCPSLCRYESTTGHLSTGIRATGSSTRT
jgi:hypothetical protein